MRKRLIIIAVAIAVAALVAASGSYFAFRHASKLKSWLVTRTCLPAEKPGKSPRNATVPKPKLKIFVIDDRHLAVAGNYGDAFSEEFRRRYRDRLTEVENLAKSGRIKEWSRRFHFNFSAAKLQADFWVPIAEAWQEPDFFTVEQDGAPKRVREYGYWPHAVGTLRVPLFTDSGTILTDSADIVPLAYIELDEPLQSGRIVRVSAKSGASAEFEFDDLKSVSSAIKVDQSGYLPDAGRKYAYLGMWQGGVLGAWDNTKLIGKPFYLRSADSGKISYRGKLDLRSREQYTKSGGDKLPLNGEIVLEMDFSDFDLPGKYFIQIPGVGRSYDFVIGPDAIGRAFFVQARGLYHQRCGMAKEEPYTKWTSDACHMDTFAGDFPPDAEQYFAKRSSFTDPAGQSVAIRHFDVVKASETDRRLPGVSGGWHDAADFDRRSYHLDASDQLLSVYWLFPENFSDGQLDLPESGNGIPDIVDEAAYGVEVWRRAQNASGGVGCWIEADSHPLEYDPAIDRQPYYLAFPTRSSSLQYAAVAAKLARTYRRLKKPDLAELYFESARRAWRFAMDQANRQSREYELPKDGKVVYTEPAELPEPEEFKAALNLFLYDRDETYLDAANRINADKVVEYAKNQKSAFYLTELLEDPKTFFIAAGIYRRTVRQQAAWLAKSQDELAYRNLDWPIDHPYFLYLGWGNANPLRRAAYFIMAYYLDGSAKYRDAALLCANWTLGANPMGRTACTGLGAVSPVHVLHLPYFADFDRRPEPPPGIAPYLFTGDNSPAASTMLFNVEKSPRADHDFAGVHFTLLPRQLTGGRTPTRNECRNILKTTIPVWRRHLNVGSYAVPQNEFSVWETIAPAAAVYGALLKPGWMPPKEWKDQEPAEKLEDLAGYIFLP